MKKIALLFLLCLLFSNIGHAEITQVCVDTKTLEKNTTLLIDYNNTATPFTITRNITCPFGCKNATNPHDQAQCEFATAMTVELFAILFVIMVFLTILAMKYKNILFYFGSGFLMFIIGAVMLWAGLEIGGTIYNNYVINGIGLFLVGIALYMFVKVAMDSVNIRKLHKMEAEGL